MNKNILNFKDFKQIFEAKKEMSPLKYIIQDTEEILDTMFDKTKNVKYKVGDNYITAEEVLKGKDMPTAVKFNILKKDYSVNYDAPISNEFFGGILIKRDYDVILKFDDKSEKKNDTNDVEYTIEFKIDLEKVTDEYVDKANAKYKKMYKDSEDDKDEDDKDEDDDDDKSDKDEDDDDIDEDKIDKEIKEKLMKKKKK